jgi:signal transduction histidine kinase
VTYPINEQALRIVDEALANAVKHSQGQSVAVRLSREARGPKIVIEDDGRGFATNASSEGYGMTSMRERSLRLPNGELRVESTPGQGTRVTLRYEEEEQR